MSEQLGLPAELVFGEVCHFIRQNCLWSTDELIADMEKVLRLLAEHASASPRTIVESLLDFSPYAKRTSILKALRTAVAARADADEFKPYLSLYKN